MKKSVLTRLGSFLGAGLLIGSMLVAMPFAGVAATATKDWKADSSGVFLISNASDMLAFAQNAEANDWYNGKAVKLTANIDMSGVTWTPIPKFRGFLEGGGFEIKNFAINSKNTRLALFDTLDGATLRNLRLTGTLLQSGGEGGMAALLAVETLGKPVTLENVYVGGTITTPNVSTNYRVGGVIAYVAAPTTFVGCASKVSINSGFKVNGGFVGANSFTSSLTFEDCVYYGTLSKQLSVETAAFVGRVVGDVTMKRCLNLSHVRSGTSQYQGALLYLDNKDFRTGGDTSALAMLCPINVVLEDCYTTLASEGDIIVGTHTARLVYSVTIKYNGSTVFKNSDNKADYKAITLLCKTLAVGSNVTLTKSNFSSVCPGFKNWVTTGENVSYGNGQQIVLVLPRNLNQMLVGSFTAGEIPPLTPYEEETTAPLEAETTTAPEETDANAETTADASVGTTDTQDTSAQDTSAQDADPSGCGAVVGGTVGAILATAGGAMLKYRKKENEIS